MEYTDDEVNDVFDEAVTVVTSAKIEATNDDRLKLYGLYKQALEGPCHTERPGVFDFTGKAKWNAWTSLGNLNSIDAMKRYCEEVHRLIPSWDPWKARALNPATKKPSMAPNVSRPVDDEEEDVPTTLCDYAASGNMQMVKEILDKGHDVNWTDEMGRTALHMAVDRNHMELAQFLVSFGANVNVQDNEGSTPLHYACLCEYRDMIKWLLSKGADKEIKTTTGELAGDFFDLSIL